MRGLALATQRLALTVRAMGVNHPRALLVTINGPQVFAARSASAAAGDHTRANDANTFAMGRHARHFTTAAPDARGAEQNEKALYARLAQKIVSLSQLNNMDVEAREEKIERTVQFFARRLQMSRTIAIQTVVRHPLIIVYSHEELERKLDWLTQQGIDDKALSTIVQRAPQILARSEEALEGTKQWFLDLGIDPLRIPFIFRMAPHVTSRTHESLNLRVAFLRGVGLDNDQIRGVLQKAPLLLTVTVENMATKVEFAKSLGVADTEAVKMVTNAPQFLWFRVDSVKRKLAAIDDMFGEGEGLRLWSTNPPLISRNTEQLRRTFEYLTNIVGMTPDRIGQDVKLIMRNVDRLVRPRYEFLRKIQSRDLDKVTWITSPESTFVSRHVGYTEFLANEFTP